MSSASIKRINGKPFYFTSNNIWLSVEDNLTPLQDSVYYNPTRFRVLVAGRRSGKTHLAKEEAIRAAQSQYNANVMIMGQSLKSIKKLYWKELKEYFKTEDIHVDNQALIITLKAYNSTIFLAGAENAEVYRGESLTFAVLDETQGILAEVWNGVVRPALSDRMGEALIIGTSKGRNNFLYEAYLHGKQHEDWHSWQITAYDAGILPHSEIDAAKASMPKVEFDREYMSSFDILQGRIYYDFRIEPSADSMDQGSLSYDCEYQGGTILVGIDFNVANMSACLGVKLGDALHIFDEVYLENGNTRMVCEEIRSRYPKAKAIFFPDPSSRARKTSAEWGVTDQTIIKEYGYSLIAPKKAPAVADRINNVNAMIKSASGARRLLIHPSCRKLIDSLFGQIYKPGTSIPDKEGGLDHMCFSGDTCVSLGGKHVPLKELDGKTEYVHVYNNMSAECAISKTGRSELIRLHLNDGDHIDCTPDHKILTSAGWVEAQDVIGVTLSQARYTYHKKALSRDDLAKFKDDYISDLAVTSISSLGVQDTYCLASPIGSFALANKVIVSNCDSLGYLICAEFPMIKRKFKKLTGFKWV